MSASQIVAMWTSGKYGMSEIARTVGVAQSTVHFTVKAAGQLDHPIAREGVRRRRSAAARAAGNLNGICSPGRPKVWPDCPPHLREDYDRLRGAGYRSGEARAMLERAEA